MNILWYYAGAGRKPGLSASEGPLEVPVEGVLLVMWCRGLLRRNDIVCYYTFLLFLLHQYSKEHAQSLQTGQTSSSPESGLQWCLRFTKEQGMGQPVLRNTNSFFCLWLPVVLEKTFLHTKANNHVPILSFYSFCTEEILWRRMLVKTH